MSNADWYARRLAQQTRPNALPRQPLAPALPQPTKPGPVEPEDTESGPSFSQALAGGDARGGARTRALAAKGRCPNCGSVNYFDDEFSNTTAHCFECNYSPRLGNALSSE